MGSAVALELAHELRRAVLGYVRNDHRLVETWTPEPRPHPDCPVTAFTGDIDPELGPEEARHGVAPGCDTEEPDVQTFPGGHWHLGPQRQPVIDAPPSVPTVVWGPPDANSRALVFGDDAGDVALWRVEPRHGPSDRLRPARTTSTGHLGGPRHPERYRLGPPLRHRPTPPPTMTTLDAGLAAYLHTNRDFMAPAVVRAVASLGLRPGARVLDAGTGAGGASPAPAGTGAIVEAIDLNAAVVEVAAEHARHTGVAEQVTLRSADLADALADAGPGYDAIWASDVVWPGNFADPAATVTDMAGALAPGGVLALFYANYYRATFLPGYGRLERLLFAASERRWKLPADGPHRHDRHLTWLLGAELTDVALAVFLRIGFPVDDVARAYLESTVWPEHLQSARECGSDVGITDADLARIEALLTPGGPDYVLDEPGYHTVHPTILATGRRP